jgi:hypothetical protein
MSFRHCTRCGTEVEDVGGYCLLGHPLRLSAPVDGLKELRAEVDRAMADVKTQVVEMLQAVPAGAGEGPPPPPSATPRPDLFAVLDSEPTSGTDPLEDFAPAPRMDWGPDRGRLRRKP